MTEEASPDRTYVSFQHRGGWIPALRVLVYIAAFLVIMLIAGIAVFLVLALLGERLSLLRATALPLPVLALLYVVIACATVLLTLAFVLFVDHRPAETLGFNRKGSWVKETWLGIALGLGLPLLMFVISYLAGWSRISAAHTAMSPGRALSIVIESLVLTIAIAVNEETMMRGYVLQTLKWGYGAVPALLITSIVFGSMHIFNPGASLAGVLGTGAAGLLLGYGYLATGRLWLSIGLHFGWNLALGPIFGFPVSGMNLESIVHQTVHGPRLWTGGSFGPEAGLLAISVIIVGAAVIRFFSRSSLYVKI